jgi:DNA (cytosine-5)-methyltransferase 1
MSKLHASPPCPNYSVAKRAAAETDLDIDVARATGRAIQDQAPPVFSLEQVYGYRTSKAFALIVQTLHALRYDVQWWHLNAADYGVAQTRRRLILVARRDGRVVRPAATHCQGGCVDMFGGRLPWVGWYRAVADLVPTFPAAHLAPWQRRRLPAWWIEPDPVLVHGSSIDLVVNRSTDPSATIRSSEKNSMPRACLVADQFSSAGGGVGPARGVTVVTDADPAFTVTTRDSRRIKVVRFDHADVRRLTPRALARLQSFPDWYALPERAALACTIIGNAVPPLLMQRVMDASAAPGARSTPPG